MKWHSLFSLGWFLLLQPFASAWAQLELGTGHVRASLPGVDSSAAYLSLFNPGDLEVTIVAITAPGAGAVTLHHSMNHNGMVHMMQMSSLPVPARQQIKLEPNGTHIMLENLVEPLRAGVQQLLVLHYADGRQQELTLPVLSVLDE
ncbi:MAG: hypothetical protein RLZZ169_384 [Pseudomonadota bacterium]|jgi:copper(I)-binding protein